MVELSARRIAAIAAVAGALVGGTVAGAVALATDNHNAGSGASAAAGDTALSTAAVVRTTLTNAQQVGGSIGYDGSYTVASPSGYSAQQVALAEQSVTKDKTTLGADQQTETDASNADTQAIVTEQGSVASDQSALSADQATEAASCAGSGASSPACASAGQKVGQDQSQLTQATQQLDTAQSSATRDQDQNQAKVAVDQAALAGDQATLATDQATALNPGTTYTALPKVGDVIKEDQSVYALSNEPVPLLYGSVAAYRAFYVGMSDGADVGELTADLVALGYGSGLAQSNHYSAATAAAVERWQSALGLPATGEILLGAVVFEPGPIRVTSVTPSVGASVGGGGGNGAGGGGGGSTVLTATSTTPIVTVDLPVSEEYEVKPGDAVSVVLPDGTSTVGGHVEKVGSVAVCPGGAGAGGGTGASISNASADQSTCSGSGSGSTSTPYVTVTVTLDSTASSATLDQAPVNVDITSQTASDVLAVPVNALLALQGGGFGVEVVDGGSTHLVGVTTGIYTRNMVQVSGPGIRVGTRVQVPSS